MKAKADTIDGNITQFRALVEKLHDHPLGIELHRLAVDLREGYDDLKVKSGFLRLLDTPTLLTPPNREKHMRRLWRQEYGDAVDSDSSIVCVECGETLVGDEPAVEIDCLNCFRDKYENDLVEGATPA